MEMEKILVGFSTYLQNHGDVTQCTSASAVLPAQAPLHKELAL